MGVDTEKFKKLFIIDDGVEILEELTEKQLIEGLVSERWNKDGHDKMIYISDRDNKVEEAIPFAA